MWAAGKLMRDVCLPKFPKITTEIADGIQKGILPDDKDAKCYINCIMEMMQTVSRCGGRTSYARLATDSIPLHSHR